MSCFQSAHQEWTKCRSLNCNLSIPAMVYGEHEVKAHPTIVNAIAYFQHRVPNTFPLHDKGISSKNNRAAFFNSKVQILFINSLSKLIHPLQL